MSKVITAVLVQAASCASILGLYFGLQPPDHQHPWWYWPVVVFVLAAAVFLIFNEVRTYFLSTPRAYRSQRKINAFMRKWVSSAGRVVIFSRDMSWAEETTIRQILVEKAERNELAICIEQPIPLTNELRRRGARVVTYGSFGHIPRSRFTIVDFERDGARVAIGAKVGNDHRIQVYQYGSHPCYELAEDLVKLLIGSAAFRQDVPQR